MIAVRGAPVGLIDDAAWAYGTAVQSPDRHERTVVPLPAPTERITTESQVALQLSNSVYPGEVSVRRGARGWLDRVRRARSYPRLWILGSTDAYPLWLDDHDAAGELVKFMCVEQTTDQLEE